MISKYYKIIFLISIFFTIFSCTKHPIPINESELITRVELTFIDKKNNTSSFLYCINDGEFGNRKDTVILSNNTQYNLNIAFFTITDALEIDSINQEIIEEADEHQIFIQSLSFTDFHYLDKDENGFPIGLNTSIKTNSNITLEYLRLILFHQPNKSNIEVQQNNPKNAGGSTDVDISIPIKLLSL